MTAATLQNTFDLPLSQLLKATADELRLAILQVLATDSYGVMELAQAFNIKQSGMSHHLKVMSSAGLISSRREGNSIFYRRAVIDPDGPFAALKKALFKQLDTQSIAGDLQANLEKVWQERAQASQRFFIENAEKFNDQQDLIANFDVYRTQVSELLNLSPIPQLSDALEVGPGQGEFLPLLSAQFERVTAVDNSAEMLAKAKHTCSEQALTNVHFIQGDTTELARLTHKFDVAVANMVLHHTPSPSLFIKHVAESLNHHGVFIMTELCHHDQSWAQSACGDIWLGFTPEDLTRWAEESALKLGQSAYFALRNGFQIQVHQFIKTP